MTVLDDEFDLDLRLSVSSPVPSPIDVGGGSPRAETADTVPPEQTCPADTCSLGCQTESPSCGDTCGCNTVETCDQQLEGCGGIFTFGPYCEDQSDGCGEPGPTGAACGDPMTEDCAHPASHDCG